MNNDKTPTPTHAFTMTSDTKVEIKRVINVVRFSNDVTRFTIETYKSGDDTTPFVTDIALSKEALGMLSAALFDAAHNMDEFKLPERE